MGGTFDITCTSPLENSWCPPCPPPPLLAPMVATLLSKPDNLEFFNLSLTVIENRTVLIPESHPFPAEWQSHPIYVQHNIGRRKVGGGGGGGAGGQPPPPPPPPIQKVGGGGKTRFPPPPKKKKKKKKKGEEGRKKKNTIFKLRLVLF